MQQQAIRAAAGWRVNALASRIAAHGEAYPSQLPLQRPGFDSARERIRSWEGYAPTPLVRAPALAGALQLQEVLLKDESTRFGTGSFKALGGALVASELASSATARKAAAARQPLSTASAGNHGIGLAWGARRAGLPCHVFVHRTVTSAAVSHIEEYGGIVHRIDGNYEDAVQACANASSKEGWQVVQDVAKEGYEEVPRRIMEGYGVIASEVLDELAAAGEAPPTHVLVNAGVGGLAAAVCAGMWSALGPARPTFISVEPLAAQCLLEAYSAADGMGARRLLRCPAGQVGDEDSTIMVGLDCKKASPMAWDVLKPAVDCYAAISDECVEPCMQLLKEGLAEKIRAGPSAVAGVGLLLAAAAQPSLRQALKLQPDSRPLVIICEGDK